MLQHQNVAMMQHLKAIVQFCNVSKFLPLTLSDATFEKRIKVWENHKGVETPCCYIEVGQNGAHMKNRVEISKTGQHFEI